MRGARGHALVGPPEDVLRPPRQRLCLCDVRVGLVAARRLVGLQRADDTWRWREALVPQHGSNTALPRYEITLNGFDLQGGSASYPPRVCEYGNTDTGDFYFDDTTAIDWDNSCSYDW